MVGTGFALLQAAALRAAEGARSVGGSQGWGGCARQAAKAPGTLQGALSLSLWILKLRNAVLHSVLFPWGISTLVN